MEKPWFPQRNSLDTSVALLRTFVFHLQIPVSQGTIEKEVKDHKEYPYLTITAFKEILMKWGVQTITLSLEASKLKDLPPFTLLFIEEKEGNIKIGQFIMFYHTEDDEIEYLHTRKGWVIEELDEFEKKWSKVALAVTHISENKGEAAYEAKEKEYNDKKFANPEFKNLKMMDGFLSAEECSYIVNLANPILQPSKLFGEKKETGIGRTSYSAEFHIYPHDEVLTGIRKKAAKVLDIPESHFEFFQCVSYEQGQEYQVHYDTFDESIPSNKAEIEIRGQRKYTMLVYLNDDYEGGGTFFPNLDYMVRPKKGRVVIFNNLDEAGKVIPAAFHAGLPVTKGRKYAINIWVRNKPQVH
jgi:prolyl 4-hydroxylase